MKIIFLGTRGNSHEKNRLHKRKCGTLIITQKHRIYVDCGLTKKIGSNSIVIITRYISIDARDIACEQSKIYTTKSIARDMKLKSVNIITCGQMIDINNVEVLPIRLYEINGRESIGILIGRIFIAHRIRKIPNIRYWLDDIKWYIGDGTRMNESNGILSQVKLIEKYCAATCFFTNCGLDVIRNHKDYSSLINGHRIAYDGMRVKTENKNKNIEK